MAKMINAEELAEIFNKLLVGNEIDDSLEFGKFMTGAAELVCDFCGGEVVNPASFGEGETPDDSHCWMIGIHANDSLPDDGGIWKDYDTDVSFINGEEI